MYRKYIITYFFLFFSFVFGQQFSNPSFLNKDGEQYDLSQKMSINMKDSDIKNVLMLIGELTDLNIVFSELASELIVKDGPGPGV